MSSVATHTDIRDFAESRCGHTSPRMFTVVFSCPALLESVNLQVRVDILYLLFMSAALSPLPCARLLNYVIAANNSNTHTEDDSLRAMIVAPKTREPIHDDDRLRVNALTLPSG